MKTFLEWVAEDLYNKIGHDLSRVALVFPNKRAHLFFNEYLSKLSDRPIWAPASVSISELFRQLSPLKAADAIALVCELYEVFVEETKSAESLDEFYFWGELLIADFDDVDKNLVDADRLFSNLSELKQYTEGYEYLEPEQEEAIRQFFANFSIERQTVLKEKFLSLWERLGTIYHRYREQLAAQGMAYEGMLYRDAIERLDTATLKYETYVFVGFNVLNKVEHRLFSQLQGAGKAMFYWDYDRYYTAFGPQNHEAGEFIKRNLKEFPNELPESVFDVMRQPKKVRYISAPTENAQARYLPEWIRSTLTENEKEHAVVLCNEALLLPVLHAIPSEVKHVNITMGFPLAQTPVYSFISALVGLQTGGYRAETGRFVYEAVKAVLKHPYTQQRSEFATTLERELTHNNRFYPLPSELQRDEFLQRVFTPCGETLTGLCGYLSDLLKEVSLIYRQEEGYEDIFNQLYRESLFKSYLTVNRLYTLAEQGKLKVRLETFCYLLDTILSGANIPFHGEPAIGLQVMGVLETRNLDFRNLVLLSLNEGQLPKAGGDSSFVPYNLRKAFGMTTIDHKNAVYAYYFYRLIQRAEQITLMYNTSSDGLNRGEWSRFMLQFLLEGPHRIKREYLEAGQSPQHHREIRIEKSNLVIERLRKRFDLNVNPEAGVLSPSALNGYLDCSLRFYFRYVANLKVPDEVSADIDSATFGTIFHKAAELVYEEMKAHTAVVRKEDLERLLRDETRLQGYVDRAFKTEFFHVGAEERPEYNGLQLINSKVILSYLKQLLRNDLQYAPFEMRGMEQQVHEVVELTLGSGERVALKLGGTIDRLDVKEDTLRIVDYKTGGSPKVPASIEELFTPGEKRPNYIFQTFIYAAIMSRQQNLKVAPALLYIHRAASEGYSPIVEMGEPRKPKVKVDNFGLLEDEFRERLDGLLKEVFDQELSFSQTEEVTKCEYCDFKGICKR
ncbi:MAG: PD-(D/E)XK nuclease family protein [Bacteroidia bacterium]|nr:PD-(D/E)XK nuclease family protein [Bacteroidia bacterium]